jgi:glutamate-1-semialdehyde 2,1-aminomutase
MQEKGYMLTDADRRCLKMLEGFLPEKIYDVHTHAYPARFMPHMADTPDSIFVTPDGSPADYNVFLKYQGMLYPGVREIRAHCLLVPDPGMGIPGSTMRAEALEYMVSELNKRPNLTAAVPAIPGDTQGFLQSQLRHTRIRGFKVYHFFAKTVPTFNADLEEYIPEAAWKVSNERGLFITVHMVKPHALADENNLAYIKTMCARYPNAKLILAHGARSFATWTAIETIRELQPYKNAYVDISALCEPQAIVEIIRELGISRVLWGSDYPVSMIRGKCVSVADSFIWLDKSTLSIGRSVTDCDLALVGIEALLAVKQACHILNLSKKDIEDLFYNNAMYLLG